MREKVKNFIYLDTNSYISIESLRIFYWATIMIPLILTVLGIAAINTIGVNFISLFPLISIGIWTLLYWIFVLILQSRKTKKTFELRFLVNGISGLLISSLFGILFASLYLLEYAPTIGFGYLLWILLFYLLFSILYIALCVLCVHKGIFKKIKEKSQTPKFLAISAFFAAILPGSGVIGMYTSKVLRSHASAAIQDFVGIFALITIIFLPILAHINFVQYFYCKKYKIFCDEYGNAASPNLEPQIKVKQLKTKKETSQKTDHSNNSLSKKKIPLIIKILIGIVSVPLIFFIIVFIISFIKVMIERI